MEKSTEITNSLENFKEFCQTVNKELHCNLEIRLNNQLKLKIPSYKNTEEILSSYESFFIKSKSSKSKKKSGTIIIVWAVCKLSELTKTPIEKFVISFLNYLHIFSAQ